jgi:NADPH:quinone reductase-like Zn-dependent oxidoreductase
MRAIVYERYGSPDVLELREVPTPVPASNEVLIRVHATTVSAADWRARSLAMPPGFGFMARLVFGVTRPRQPILGTELAGVIERIGSDVTKFRVGDAVFAYTGARMGAHAEYVCMREDGHLAPKPANLTFEQAAALCFGGVVALGFFPSGLADLLRAPLISLMTRNRVVAGPAPVPADDVRQVAELAVAGHFTPVIDRTYAFEQIIDAHKYVDQGHKRGSVAITVAS